MLKVNENFVKLPASYLFVDINNKVNAFMKEHPEQEIIRLGIGDVTRPLPKAVVEAMCRCEGDGRSGDVPRLWPRSGLCVPP